MERWVQVAIMLAIGVAAGAGSFRRRIGTTGRAETGISRRTGASKRGKPMKHEPTYTAGEVAQLTGTPLAEIRRLIRSGDIVVTRTNGRGRVSQRQLDALLRHGQDTRIGTATFTPPLRPRQHGSRSTGAR